MKRLIATVVVLMATATLAIGTGGASAATRSADRGATVATAARSLGRILVDSRGRTLYLFEKDKRGRSACSGTCATYWPPLLTKRHADRGPRGRSDRCSASPAAPTGRRRSRTPATRSTSSCRTRSRVRPAARACTTSAPPGTCSRPAGKKIEG